jgi:type II secretion system protein H
MVVIAIMGLITSFVLPYIPTDKADRMRSDADRFESLVSYAQTQAILQSQDLGLIVDGADYHFLKLESGSWQALEEEPLNPQKLESYLTQTLYVEDEAVTVDPLDDIVPSVLLFSSGEISPFEYTLSLSEQQLIRLKYNLLGEVEREYVDETQ